MSQDTREVFGIAPAPEDDRHYIFLDVIGEVVNGKLTLLRDAKKTFPTHGNVFVDEAFWIPPEGVGATWRVKHTRTAAPGVRQAEYSAVGRGLAQPLEIITISARSDSPDAIREQLLAGQDLDYVPASTILVQLGDEVVVGPVRCEALDEGFGFRCRPEAFYEPLGMWSDSAMLEPLSFLDGERAARTYTAFLTLPEPDTYLDCAELDHAIRAILKIAREEGAVQPALSKRQVESLAHVIAELSVPAKLEQRMTRVLTAFERQSLSQAALIAFREHLQGELVTQHELAALRDQERQSAKSQLLQEQRSLVATVRDLRSQKESLAKELDGLSQKISAAEKDFVATIDKTSKEISDQIAEIKEQPATLLSQVALLRPFLINGNGRSIEQKLEPLRVKAPTTLSSVDSVSDLHGLIERNLLAVGLIGASAKRVTREVLAASIAGQAPIFSGSLCNQLARAVALAFAGELAYEYRVPIGLLDSRQLTDYVQVAVEESNAADAVSVVIVEGLNRSAFEAYGEELLNQVIVRQLPNSVSGTGPVFLGTVCHGPSTLPITGGLTEIGPIIDTDTLTIANRPATVALEGGRIVRRDWGGWLAKPGTEDKSIEPADTLLRAMQGEESVLWRRLVRNAYLRLTMVEGAAGSTPLQSLAFGWLIPRAHTYGVPKDLFLSELSAALGEEGDPRVGRLLHRFYPDEQARS